MPDRASETGGLMVSASGCSFFSSTEKMVELLGIYGWILVMKKQISVAETGCRSSERRGRESKSPLVYIFLEREEGKNGRWQQSGRVKGDRHEEEKNAVIHVRFSFFSP